MKKNYVLWILLGLMVLFIAVSCKSAPPPADVVPPTAAEPDLVNVPPDQATTKALNDAAARAAAARKQVLDYEGNLLFPSDWQSADSLYSQAESQKRTFTRRDAEESTGRYNKAADALEALAAKTLAKNYENKQKELTDARNAAVQAGAQALIPELLLDADNSALDADAKYKAKNYSGAKDQADEALGMYTALKTGLDAYKIREEIYDRGFYVYDPLNIDLSDETLMEAAGDYSIRNISAAQDKAEIARLRYGIALKNGWESYAAEKGADASTERQRALDYKANVAVRQEFNSAQTIYNQANTAFQRHEDEEAAKLFEESESMFTVIAEVAREKQRAAEAALNRASQKMTESDMTAKNAEVILEGGN